MRRATKFLRRRWRTFKRTPLGGLLRLFVGRMFHGGAEAGSDSLGMGVGVLVILLAMPGLLASLLMLEEYGSLIRYLRGDGVFDPFVATLPDEYFFIVLSMFVTGVATLWRWDSLFLDRRDYLNLVPLPVSLGNIFWANFCAIVALAGCFTIVVNAVSVILFPAAVVGSQDSVLVAVAFRGRPRGCGIYGQHVQLLVGVCDSRITVSASASGDVSAYFASRQIRDRHRSAG